MQPTGAILIQASGAGTGQAILQTSIDLATWTDLLAGPADAQSLEYRNDLAEQLPARYYRVLLTP
jgi:hypothetical protein